MKYEKPLEKTPCIKALIAITLGASSSQELLELGVAKSRNTLYEILDSLETENLILKDPTEKPMPIKPNLERLLAMLQVRQLHHGLGFILLPQVQKQFNEKFRKMRNKNNLEEAIRIIREFDAALSKEEKEASEKEIVDNMPVVINECMEFYLKNISKLKKKERKEAYKLYSVINYTHFAEFLDSFFVVLINNAGKIRIKIKSRKDREQFASYVKTLKEISWHTSIGLEMIKGNKTLADFYSKTCTPFGL